MHAWETASVVTHGSKNALTNTFGEEQEIGEGSEYLFDLSFNCYMHQFGPD